MLAVLTHQQVDRLAQQRLKRGPVLRCQHIEAPADLGAEIVAHRLLALPRDGSRCRGGLGYHARGLDRRIWLRRARFLYPLLLHCTEFAHAALRLPRLGLPVDKFTCSRIHVQRAATSSAALPSGSLSFAAFPCAVL